MSILSAVANSWILVAAVPYLVIAGYDFCLHESDRNVPRLEAQFHAVIIVSVAAFLISATLGWNRAAAIALLVLIPAAAVDELRFHKNLNTGEKRVHVLGGLALMFCIGVWFWTT